MDSKRVTDGQRTATLIYAARRTTLGFTGAHYWSGCTGDCDVCWYPKRDHVMHVASGVLVCPYTFLLVPDDESKPTNHRLEPEGWKEIEP